MSKTPWKPELLKDYRILAIQQSEYQRFVGRVITVLAAVSAPGSMWQVRGTVHGELGQWEFTCALQKETGNCLCDRYPFPHKRGFGCKIAAERKTEH